MMSNVCISPEESNFFRQSYENRVNAVVNESTPLSNKIIEIVESYFSCFNLNIETNHPPKLYTQDSHELFNGCSFFDLAKSYFNANAFLYLAVIDSKDRNSCVVELSALSSWYKEKRWSAIEFKNPLTRNICERIRILEVNQCGNNSILSDVQSMRDFQIVSENILKNAIVMNAITAQEEQVLNHFDDGEIVIFLAKALEDPSISISINWKSIAAFINHGSSSRRIDIVNQLESRNLKLASKNADYHQCLGDFYLNYHNYHNYHNHFLHISEQHYLIVLALEKKSLVALEMIYLMMSNRKGLNGMISELHNSIRFRPTPVKYCLLGEAHFHSCELQEALNSFQKAVELDPEFHVANLKLADIKDRLFLESKAKSDILKEVQA